MVVSNPDDERIAHDQAISDITDAHERYLFDPNQINWSDVSKCVACARKFGATDEEISEAIRQSINL